MDKKENAIVDKEFNNFLSKVKKIAVEKVILFGSRARGDEWVHSDYDLILVSKKFQDMKWHKRIEGVVKNWKLDRNIDVLPYTPKEFEDKKRNSSNVRSALKNSKVIAG